MDKENIKLKKDDRVYYTLPRGTEGYLIVDGYAGYTIKEFNEEDGSTITKIERPEYKIIYEAPKPILDKEEKEYLEAILRPFKNRVKVIKKVKLRAEEKEYLYIFLGNDDIILPSFIENTMYKGMGLNKQYTLAELGLFMGE